jgi:XTP/dITP diphosphohydrolase
VLHGESDRRAWYHAVLVLVRSADDPQPLIAEGSWHGEIAREPHGDGGFGYDPIFWLPERGCTSAELDLATKQQLSHRGQALRALLARLPGHW